MSATLLNQWLRLSLSSLRKLSSKLMVFFVILTALILSPDAYCMMEGDEEEPISPTTPRQTSAPQEAVSLEQAVPPEILTHILSFLKPKELMTTNSRVSKSWREAASEAARGKTLDLSSIKLTNEQLVYLGTVPFAGLILKDCGLSIEAVRIIAGFGHLKSLNLDTNNIEDEGATALANGKLTHLMSLNLASNSIGADGAKALLAKGNLTDLTSLHLWNNNMGDEGAKALATGNPEHLTSLYLGCNGIGDEGAKALANGNLTCLISLDLSSSTIGHVGAEAIATGNLKNLISLYLRHNGIGDAGVEALTTGNLENLTSLDLGNNNIRDAGATALANGKLVNLTSLNLEYNQINPDTKVLLRTVVVKHIGDVWL